MLLVYVNEMILDLVTNEAPRRDEVNNWDTNPCDGDSMNSVPKNTQVSEHGLY